MSEFWTSIRITALRKAIADGLSRSQIADLIGCSRSAVIGKANRLGLKVFHSVQDEMAQRRARLERRRALYRARNPVEPLPKSSATPMPLKLHAPTVEHPSASEPLPGTEPRPLMQLKVRMCRWPLGLNEQGDRMFCSARTPEISVYCEHHAAMSVGRRAA